jgi:hypothetical protein
LLRTSPAFKVLERGMSRGVKFDGSPLELLSLYDLDQVRELDGIIDYTVGPSSVKAFVLAEHSDPKQRQYSPMADGHKNKPITQSSGTAW